MFYLESVKIIFHLSSIFLMWSSEYSVCIFECHQTKFWAVQTANRQKSDQPVVLDRPCGL